MHAKKICALALLLASLLYALQVVTACFSPADLYAVEVLLNKPGVSYSLDRLSGVLEVEYAGGKAYAYRSHYDERLVVLLSEQELAGGRYLGVRLQVPVEEEVVTVFRCRLPGSGCSTRLPVGRVVNITPGSGEATLEVGVISFKAPSFVVFKPVLRVLEGGVNLTVSGVLTLEATPGGEPPRRGGGVYHVAMPCLLAQGAPCYRVMVVIPGYDAPLRVEEGAYRATLKLSWISTGSARVSVEELEVRCEGEVLPQPLPRGWALEDGVLTGSVGSARVRVYLESGTCEVVVPGSAESLPGEVEEQLKSMLAPAGLGSAALECSAAVDKRLKPSVSVGEEEVRAALRRELEWLVESGVVEGLSSSDIEAITAAARLGYAGWNRRLAWHMGAWKPYDEVPGAVLLRCTTGVAEVFSIESSAYEQLRPASAGGAPEGAPSSTPAALVVALAVLLAATLAYLAAKHRAQQAPGTR